MSQVFDRLAELTAFRDRDVVDTTLASALRELVGPQQVAIHRCVGGDRDPHWFTPLRLGRDDLAATTDPLWTELHELPPLLAFPERLCALQQQAPVALPGSPHRTVFPLTTDLEVACVLELCTEAALDPAAYGLVNSILRIYRNFQALLDYSERDTLTGLLNRKTFDEAFYKLSGGSGAAVPTAAAARAEAGLDIGRRAAITVRPHYLCVIDIDHFKKVNDRHGHLIGDEVLLLLSRLMRSVFRFNDRLYRFGGEEFVVLMRCGSDADALSALERLRSAVQGYAFPQVGGITVSAGFTRVKPGDTPSSAFQRADRAVYWVKANGRNQVRGHAALVAEGRLADDSRVGDVELF